METAVAEPTKILPLKDLFSQFLDGFLKNVKPNDTLSSSVWAKELRERTVNVLGTVADQYGFELRPIAGIGSLRRTSQYITFLKKPLRTSRGFYVTIGFNFDGGDVEYAMWHSEEHELSRDLVESIADVAREALPDFTLRNRQGLPSKSFVLARANDQELTQSLVQLLDGYKHCVEELSEEIESLGEVQGQGVNRAQLSPDHLDHLLDAYLSWCAANRDDQHLRDEHPAEYAQWSESYFRSLPADKLLEEMTTFVVEGGKVQSGGARGRKQFLKAISGREEEFRAHLLKVYEPGFDVETWWEECQKFPRFGRGIRSIFLHRTHPTKYAIYNQKALDGYRTLGVLRDDTPISQVTFTDINNAALAIQARRPDQLSLYLVDHLTHYITIPEGKQELNKLQGKSVSSLDGSTERHRTWLIAGGGKDAISNSFVHDSYIAIDFDIREDLAPCDDERKIKAAIARTHGGDEDRRSWTSSCYNFSHGMQPGDLVVLRGGLRGIIAVGVITAGYTFLSGKDHFPHTRKVEWVFTKECELPENISQFRQDTLVEITSDSPRIHAIKEVTQWSTFESKLLEIRDRAILAPPFSHLFADREEANAAFDLIKETLERLNLKDPHSDRLALTLPNNGAKMSVNYGARLLLHFTKDNGRLRLSFCANREDLSPGEEFEGGEFSSNKEGIGIGLQHRAFSDFRSSAELKARYLRAIDTLRATYDQRTPFSRWHIPQLVEAALDHETRDRLLGKGLRTFATETMQEQSSPRIDKEIQVAKGRNVIYFGPPGTGKTWTLLTQERNRFVASASSMSQEERLQALVADEPWWVVVGAALYLMGPSKVPDIKEHPLLKARFAITNVKAPNSALWVPLQTHTSPGCEHVALSKTSRIEPFIFEKSADSVWMVLKDRLDTEAPEVIALVEAMQQKVPSGATISRYETVTFHQSFSYEDFIEGIKPRVGVDGAASIGYEIQPGVFKRLCDRARADKEHEYAIFIDEINRGNVASIFGELISLIEEDKREGAPRELAVRLPYSKELFSVPANVSIIGTMNSADRSVEALDSALRRRFSFIEVSPSVDVLRDARIEVEGIDIPRLFEVINQRLEKLLNRDHQIGHAYFLELQNGKSSLEGLRSLFQSKIVPLLQEYFYSDLGRIGLVVGDAFVERVDTAEFASFDHQDTDLLRERQIYRLKDPSKLTAHDFRSIYGG